MFCRYIFNKLLLFNLTVFPRNLKHYLLQHNALFRSVSKLIYLKFYDKITVCHSSYTRIWTKIIFNISHTYLLVETTKKYLFFTINGRYLISFCYFANCSWKRTIVIRTIRKRFAMSLNHIAVVVFVYMYNLYTFVRIHLILYINKTRDQPNGQTNLAVNKLQRFF